jgi:hypothetical protein
MKRFKNSLKFRRKIYRERSFMKFFEHETGRNTAGYHLESSNILKRNKSFKYCLLVKNHDFISKEIEKHIEVDCIG